MCSMIRNILSNWVELLPIQSNLLGASIFVPDNRILVQAAEDFGLEMSLLKVVSDDDDDDDDIGMLFLVGKS